MSVDRSDRDPDRGALLSAFSWTRLATVLVASATAISASPVFHKGAWAPAIFLGFATALLVGCLSTLYNAGRALFVEPAVVARAATGRRRKELEREKASLLKAIKELEFDHEMHKVSDADFAEIGGVYRGRAMRVMRQLDETRVDYTTLIEDELKKKHGTSRPRPVAAGCPQCTTRNDSDAVFCKKCGHRLAGSAS